MERTFYWESSEFAFDTECNLYQLKGIVLKLI